MQRSEARGGRQGSSVEQPRVQREPAWMRTRRWAQQGQAGRDLRLEGQGACRSSQFQTYYSFTVPTMGQVSETDLRFLRRAIELATKARADGRHPFGAVVVNERGEMVVEARNNAVLPNGNPTQHAEMVACAEVSRLLTVDELAKCTMYASTEPCAMCAGAIYWVGIGRVVFGLPEQGLMRCTGGHEENPTLDLPCREVFARGQRKIVVVGPLLEDEASKVHEGFWTR
jgi:tRNA(Arg) A34 adenosine deaminase TadA